jgi:hypothetical protein
LFGLNLFADGSSKRGHRVPTRGFDPEPLPEPVAEPEPEPEAPTFRPAPSEGTRMALRASIGAIPELRPRAPLDPERRWLWERMHPGLCPDGGMTRVEAFNRLESFEQPIDRLFDLGIMVVSARIYEAYLTPPGRYCHHQPGFAEVIARHARGVLGDGATLDLSKPTASVRSRHHCVGEKFKTHGQFRDPAGCDLVVQTIFGLPGVAGDLAITATVISFDNEPCSRLLLPTVAPGIRPPVGIVTPYQMAGF